MKIQLRLSSKMPKLFIPIVACLVIFGCGSDGGESNSNTSESIGTISGIVGGTTILVIDDDGMIVASDDTKRRLPDLDMDGDGIEDSYSFTIAEVPMDMNIRIYLVESTGVSPLNFVVNGTSVNVFSLSSSEEINLGFVHSIEGKAISEYNPSDAPNVNPEGADNEMKAISQAVANDFVGNWHGDVFYKVGFGKERETGTTEVTIILEESEESLVGTFYFSEKTQERTEEWDVNITGTLSEGGTLSILLPKPRELAANEDCDTWNVFLTAYLKDEHTMDIDFDGTVCSGRYGDFSDILTNYIPLPTPLEAL